MLTNIFSTPVFVKKLIGVNNDEIEKFVYVLKDTSKGRQVSNEGGYQSDLISPYENLVFETLRKNILLESENFLNQIGLSNNEKYISSMWVNVNKYRDYNLSHNHGGRGNVLSGCYYVKRKINSGNIVFLRDDKMHEVTFSDDILKEYNQVTSTRWIISTEISDLVLFPANLNHYVEPNMEEEDRISIAFNICFKQM